jgi:hypothetical protein
VATEQIIMPAKASWPSCARQVKHWSKNGASQPAARDWGEK